MALAAAQLRPGAQRRDDRRAVAFRRLPDEARDSSPGSGPAPQPAVRGAGPAADGGTAKRLLVARSGAHHRQVRGTSRRSKARQRGTFVTLEDWANDGPPVAGAAGREMFEGLFRDDLPGAGAWCVGGEVVDPGRSMSRSQYRLDHRPHRPARHRAPAPASGSISRWAMSAWWSARAHGNALGAAGRLAFPRCSKLLGARPTPSIRRPEFHDRHRHHRRQAHPGRLLPRRLRRHARARARPGRDRGGAGAGRGRAARTSPKSSSARC